MGVFDLTGKPVKNVNQCAISDHLLQCICLISFDNFDIFASDTKTLDASL